MVIEVSCPECLREYRVSDDKAGKRFRCKQCNHAVSIPNNESDDWDDFGSYSDAEYGSEDEYDEPYRASRSSTRRKKKKRRSGKAKPLATIGSRVAAAMLDGFLYTLAYLVPIIVAIALAPKQIEPEDEEVMTVILMVVGSLLLMLGLQVYLLVMRSQTIGKILMKIRIDDFTTRQPAGIANTFGLRMIVHQLIVWIPLVGAIYAIVDIIMLFIDENNRCLHDQLANTYVVDIS